ncbi:MAG: phosphoenolpyruvate carboxykinase (ATP) [Deltaproteobacteria bacterium]|nr:phosphoenolpyruvate carboxykinase (ATP) [Deltaproteobacteria bacterium]
MTSKSTFKYYESHSDISLVRAAAETLFNEKRKGKRSEVLNMKALYEKACNCSGVTSTDRKVDPDIIREFNLPFNAHVLNHNHGRVVGRNAKIRHFYNRARGSEKKELESLVLEAVYQMSHRELFIAEACLGLDPDLMIKARMITSENNLINMYNWSLNFMPFELIKDKYSDSAALDIQDILVVSFPDWKDDLKRDEYKHGTVIVDYEHNTIFILGLRYFGEHKKGTLTLAWSSGMRLGRVACHGGIKEADFNDENMDNSRKVIAFFGLSGSGKSSHTNSHDNGGSLPENTVVTIAHDDAFQIDLVNKKCTVWEPSLFDKTDQRPYNHPDWKQVVSTQNQLLVCDEDNNIFPGGLDVRNKNGRAIFSRSLLGRYKNSIGFPDSINWLMKDSSLPPVIKLGSPELAVAFGTTLMTKRTAAEDVSEDEMNKLVFEPFANPFRVYELYKDCEGFLELYKTGADFHSFNSGGFWKTSDSDVQAIPLKLSLRLQTALLKNEISWIPWTMLKNAFIPEPSCIDKIWPGYSKIYDSEKVINKEKYDELFKSRMAQRIDFIEKSLRADRPDLCDSLIHAFE